MPQRSGGVASRVAGAGRGDYPWGARLTGTLAGRLPHLRRFFPPTRDAKIRHLSLPRWRGMVRVGASSLLVKKQRRPAVTGRGVKRPNQKLTETQAHQWQHDP